MLKKMDLEKAITIVSLLLLPAGGFWIYDLSDRLETGRQALADATRGDAEGLILQLGSIEKQMGDLQETSKRHPPANASTYFEKMVHQTRLPSYGAALSHQRLSKQGRKA